MNDYSPVSVEQADAASRGTHSNILGWLLALLLLQPVGTAVCAGIISAAILDTEYGFLVGSIAAIVVRQFLIRRSGFHVRAP